MGYYTAYSMVARNVGKSEVDDLISKIKATNVADYIDTDSCYIAPNGDVEFNANDLAKWYDHDEDMLILSSLLPTAIFKLHGEGEETGDIWDAYYRNNELEHCPYSPIEPTKIRWRRRVSEHAYSES